MLWLWFVWVIGCGGKHHISKGAEPARVVELMREAPLPYALQARFNVEVEGPGVSGSTPGALIMHVPDKFRIEIQTPMRTPFLYVASDGQGIHAWLHRDQVFLRGNDATAVLEEMTGGALSISDLFAVLTGRLPFRQAEMVSVSAPQKGWVDVVFQGPNELLCRAQIESKYGLVRQLMVGRELPDAETCGDPTSPECLGLVEVLFTVRYPDLMHFQGTMMPEEVFVDFPKLGWSLEIEVHTWDELGVIPDAFTLSVPNGAEEKDLVESLRKIAESAHPQP